MDLGIKNKNVLVTGGSHGIGLATAIQLATEGCNIAICSRSKDRLSNAKNKLSHFNTKILTIQADVLQESEPNKVMDIIEKEWGGVSILINNVGGGGRWGKENIEETAMDVWRDVYNKNAMAAISFTKRVIPYMRKNKWGRVITVTSIFGGKDGNARPWFAMAKSAETSLMKSLASTKYLVRDGITFNSVAPGGIYIKETGFEEEQKNNPREFQTKIDNDYPLGRLGTPEEVASLITFICSSQASLVNGANITVDGGQSKSI